MFYKLVCKLFNAIDIKIISNHRACFDFTNQFTIFIKFIFTFFKTGNRSIRLSYPAFSGSNLIVGIDVIVVFTDLYKTSCFTHTVLVIINSAVYIQQTSTSFKPYTVKVKCKCTIFSAHSRRAYFSNTITKEVIFVTVNRCPRISEPFSSPHIPNHIITSYQLATNQYAILKLIVISANGVFAIKSLVIGSREVIVTGSIFSISNDILPTGNGFSCNQIIEIRINFYKT